MDALKLVSKSSVLKDIRFFSDLKSSLNVWVYMDDYLLKKYNLGLCSYIDKEFKVKTGYFKPSLITDNVMAINITDESIVDRAYMVRVYGDTWFEMLYGHTHTGRFRNDIDEILNRYNNVLAILENTALSSVKRLKGIMEQRLREQELERQRIEQIEKQGRLPQNVVILRFSNNNYYKLSFHLNNITLEKSSSVALGYQNKQGIDQRTKLVSLLHQYLEVYGFNIKDNLDIILEDCDMLKSTYYIMKLILVLTDNLTVVSGEDYGVKTKSFNSLKLPLKIDLVKLASELNKITCGENTKATVPHKLHRYPFLKHVDYLCGGVCVDPCGDRLLVHINLKTSTYPYNRVRKLIQRDIKNIIKEFYRGMATNQYYGIGEHAPINMYKVKSYRLVNIGLLEIIFQLKIQSNEVIVKDTLDDLKSPYDK